MFHRLIELAPWCVERVRLTVALVSVSAVLLTVSLHAGFVVGQGFDSYSQCANLDSPGIGDIYVYGVLGPVIDSAQDCLNLCSSTAGCIGAVYSSASDGHQCFLKNTNVLTVGVAALSDSTYFIRGGYGCPAIGSPFISTVYVQCSNLDSPGVGDIAVNGVVGFPLPNVFDCMDLCSSVSGCVGAVYYEGKCFAKSSDVLTVAVSVLAPDQYFIRAEYGCPTAGNTFSSTKYVQCADLDTPGQADIPNAALAEPSLAACMRLCDETAGCVAAVYANGNCFPKDHSVLAAPTAVLSPDSFIIPLGYGCPSAGSTVASAQYVQCANLDSPGVGDIAINGVVGPQEASVAACMALCAVTPGCIGAVYYNGQCFAKSSAILTAPVASLSPDTYFIAGYSCPVTTFISTQYLQCSNLDTPGVGDIAVNGIIGIPQATVDDCMELCATTGGCIGAVYYEGACFPKSSAILGAPTTFLAMDTFFILHAYDTNCPAPGAAF